VVTLVVALGLIASGAPHLARAIAWPLTTSAAVTWLQVARRVCVRFGATGVENFGSLGNETPVDPRTLVADRRRAIEIILEGTLIGLLATVALVGAPV
jgi:hypothetical protein